MTEPHDTGEERDCSPQSTPSRRQRHAAKPPLRVVDRPTKEPERLTDVGNARRLVDLHGEDFRFVSTWGKWLTWDGKRWTLDEGEVRMQAFAKKTARSLYDEAYRESDPERRTALARHAARSETRARIDAMIALAKSEPGIAIEHKSLDVDPWKLNVENGTIDLTIGDLRPHDRRDLITKLAPVVYDPERVECPTFDAFLARCMGGNRGVIDYLFRIVGYALTGSTREHALFFFYGDGRNGKSTFLNVLHEILGDYATRAPRGLLFVSKGGERHPTELAGLHGARLVSCSEIKEGDAFDEALVKDLTGGDRISARRMREDFWSFDPTHKLFVAGNHKPRIDGRDEGVWSRIRLVPWTVTIPKAERDKDLAAKLAREKHSILARLVEGCVVYRREGLGDPSAVIDATDAYRAESDPFAEFFASRCSFSPDAKCVRRHLRRAYEQWCEDTDSQPLGAKRFAAALRARGVEPGGTMRTHQGPREAWRGLTLRSEDARTFTENDDEKM
jgi:putative DNA primase/helicase